MYTFVNYQIAQLLNNNLMTYGTWEIIPSDMM